VRELWMSGIIGIGIVELCAKMLQTVHTVFEYYIPFFSVEC